MHCVAGATVPLRGTTRYYGGDEHGDSDCRYHNEKRRREGGIARSRGDMGPAILGEEPPDVNDLSDDTGSEDNGDVPEAVDVTLSAEGNDVPRGSTMADLVEDVPEFRGLPLPDVASNAIGGSEPPAPENAEEAPAPAEAEEAPAPEESEQPPATAVPEESPEEPTGSSDVLLDVGNIISEDAMMDMEFQLASEPLDVEGEDGPSKISEVLLSNGDFGVDETALPGTICSQVYGRQLYITTKVTEPSPEEVVMFVQYPGGRREKLVQNTFPFNFLLGNGDTLPLGYYRILIRAERSTFRKLVILCGVDDTTERCQPCNS